MYENTCPGAPEPVVAPECLADANAAAAVP